jgi:D-hydroxyproline dehydrogenase subunit gamma
MFRRLPDRGAPGPAPFSWMFEGRACAGYPGESVAAALLRQGIPFIRRHPIDGSPRLPYCMMGQCQECLVRVGDGPAQRACMLPVREDMRVRPAGPDAPA